MEITLTPIVYPPYGGSGQSWNVVLGGAQYPWFLAAWMGQPPEHVGLPRQAVACACLPGALPAPPDKRWPEHSPPLPILAPVC